MRTTGKKTQKWSNVRRALKPRFEKAGVVRCEARCAGCMRDDGLSFAHRYKRRFVTTDEELNTVALVCLNCHGVLDEKLSHEDMKREVDRMIAEREIQP